MVCPLTALSATSVVHPPAFKNVNVVGTGLDDWTAFRKHIIIPISLDDSENTV
jgi:hypothetical protein